jgi:hypothetical protein
MVVMMMHICLNRAAAEEDDDSEEEIYPEFISTVTSVTNPAFEQPLDMWAEGPALNRAMMRRQQHQHQSELATEEVDLH